MNTYFSFLNKILFSFKLIFAIQKKATTSISDVIKNSGGYFIEVYPEQPIERSKAHRLGSIQIVFPFSKLNDFPKSGVFEINNCFVSFPDGSIFTNNGNFIKDSSWYHDDSSNISTPGLFKKINSLKGRTILLATDFAIHNWSHFITDLLPRIHLFQKAGFDFNSIDHILCSETKLIRVVPILRTLGIPISKCIWARSGEFYNVESLIATTFPGLKRTISPWAVKYLRTSLLPEASDKKSRRLYLSRKGLTRSVLNENELIKILSEFKFETYDPLKESDPFKDFAEAEIIIGAHGAALTNILFCKPKTKILELIPTDHIFQHFYEISSRADLQYHYLAGNSLHLRPKGSFGPSLSDFYIDPIEFKNALIELTKD
jgi:hypothetical protein